MHQQQGRDEVRDRVRRIETRLTIVAKHFGIDVGGGQPLWDDSRGVVTIPTPNCSIGEMLKVVPEDRRHTEVKVYVHGSYLFTMVVDPQ